MFLWLIPFKKHIAIVAVIFLVLLVLGHKTGLVQEHLGVDFGPLVPGLIDDGVDWLWTKVEGIWDWIANLWSEAKIDNGPSSTEVPLPDES